MSKEICKSYVRVLIIYVLVSFILCNAKAGDKTVIVKSADGNLVQVKKANIATQGYWSGDGHKYVYKMKYLYGFDGDDPVKFPLEAVKYIEFLSGDLTHEKSFHMSETDHTYNEDYRRKEWQAVFRMARILTTEDDIVTFLMYCRAYNNGLEIQGEVSDAQYSIRLCEISSITYLPVSTESPIAVLSANWLDPKDTIKLRDGTSFNGVLVTLDGTIANFYTIKSGLRTFKRTEIESISFGLPEAVSPGGIVKKRTKEELNTNICNLKLIVTTSVIGVYSLGQHDLDVSITGPVNLQKTLEYVPTATAKVFDFNNLPYGKYSINAKYGKKTVTKNVDVSSTGTIEILIVF